MRSPTAWCSSPSSTISANPATEAKSRSRLPAVSRRPRLPSGLERGRRVVSPAAMAFSCAPVASRKGPGAVVELGDLGGGEGTVVDAELIRGGGQVGAVITEADLLGGGDRAGDAGPRSAGLLDAVHVQPAP